MTTHKHIMLDLETLSTRPNAAILTIGAVKFTPGQTTPTTEDDTFFRRVAIPPLGQANPYHIDSETLWWWVQQSEPARKAAFNPQGALPIRRALVEFTSWLGPHDYKIWGNGAAFDNAVLAHAYGAEGFKVPWSYKNDRCLRTLWAMAPDIDPAREGTHHDALDDALHQVKALQAIWQTLTPDQRAALE